MLSLLITLGPTRAPQYKRTRMFLHDYLNFHLPYIINSHAKNFNTPAPVVKTADFTIRSRATLGMYPFTIKVINEGMQKTKNPKNGTQSCIYGYYTPLLEIIKSNTHEKPNSISLFFESHADHMLKPKVPRTRLGKKHRRLNHIVFTTPPLKIIHDLGKKIGKLSPLINVCPKLNILKNCCHPYDVQNAAENYIAYKRFSRNRSRQIKIHKCDVNYSNSISFVLYASCSYNHSRYAIGTISSCHYVKPGADANLDICLKPNPPLAHIISISRNRRKCRIWPQGPHVKTRPQHNKIGKTNCKSDILQLKYHP